MPGRFFAKSGNGRGMFPDQSVEELSSLFTNDDEKTAACPCSVADGEIIPPTTPAGCPIPDPVIQEITPEDFITP